jgi:hypothetical protein
VVLLSHLASVFAKYYNDVRGAVELLRVQPNEPRQTGMLADIKALLSCNVLNTLANLNLTLEGL